MAADGIPRRTLAGLILGTLVVGGGLTAAITLLLRTGDRDSREVVTAAQRVLRERFPQAEIRFAPLEETHVESKGENRYLVTGWMEVTDEQGAKATLDFSCIMLAIPGGIWVSEKVDVMPRP